MDWVNAIQSAIEYIECHITDDISAEDVADYVHISSFHFQKGFSMLCGYSIMEYIRNRRLALAGGELATTDEKVIDVAMKYGYNSPDSFAKAFSRFHGISPTMVRKSEAMIKTFAPLKLEISLKGGYLMNYKIVEKESFTVLAVAKKFNYQDCKKEIPVFWKEHYEKGNDQYVCGMFGINIDEQMGHDQFEYLIADIYNPIMEVPEGFIVKTIPAFTWAVFSCDGPMPSALQDVNTKIFSEWLPALKEYEFAAGYCVEMYDAPDQYPKGTQDENYHSEIWIPIKKK
ncbi:MAG: AraC family transcriptional regulator [Lachnospiraceae bacterium]|nr:AraC family transcriptional regulator [Lachnospiraceae bacterium]